jgi:hypothetical protein
MKSNNRSIQKAKVFFKKTKTGETAKHIASDNLELLKKIDAFDAVKPGDFVAIKMHFGDNGNIGHIKPETVKVLAGAIKAKQARPFLVETSTLYVGERSNAYDHINIAYKHGFTFENTGVPIIMADGLLGSSQSPVKINGKHYKEVFVASDALHYDFLFCLNHVTGHIITGIGAAIKNIGMGLTARGGKLSQHSGVLPSIDGKKCIKCARCVEFCPAGAIGETEKSYVIDAAKCIGCGECISICKNNAVKFSWKQSSKIVQEKMAEHALGVVGGIKDRLLLTNHIIHVTKECDCMAKDEKCVIGDTGILASSDPVALDKATIDMVSRLHSYPFNYEDENPLNPLHQLEHGQKIGLGTMDYELIEI